MTNLVTPRGTGQGQATRTEATHGAGQARAGPKDRHEEGTGRGGDARGAAARQQARRPRTGTAKTWPDGQVRWVGGHLRSALEARVREAHVDGTAVVAFGFIVLIAGSLICARGSATRRIRSTMSAERIRGSAPLWRLHPGILRPLFRHGTGLRVPPHSSRDNRSIRPASRDEPSRLSYVNGSGPMGTGRNL
ncbi:MAG: hypothetical protein JWM72_322 [Actinomycetia bacterium]|nr:hypothetical protein [Actinomycetes bacterium]